MREYVFLGKENAQEVFDLQNEIIEGLSDKDFLRNNSLELFEESLDEPNIAIGLYDNEKLVASCILVMAGSQVENVHLASFLTGKGAYYKSIMVASAFRGQGLQREMSLVVEEMAKRKGANWLWLTVAPANSFSKNNFLKLGYIVDHQEEKYGGKLRDIMYKILD